MIYLKENSNSTANCFFVYQSKHLRCLNGAYFSICDDRLLKLIINEKIVTKSSATISMTSTAEVFREVRQRIGQTQFSEAVKKNYKYKCCFPGCNIDDPRFLVGSHIARWVDNPEKRGNISNGLCFCAFHDKAFENGYFSLDDKYCIVLSQNPKILKSSVYINYILPFKHHKIDKAEIPPDKYALKEHRFRCNIIDYI
jgi:hypothetical protein